MSYVLAVVRLYSQSSSKDVDGFPAVMFCSAFLPYIEMTTSMFHGFVASAFLQGRSGIYIEMTTNRNGLEELELTESPLGPLG